MKIHSIIILLIVIREIASNSPGKRKIRCCGNILPFIFKKLSRRSSKTVPVKHTNVVLLSETADHSPSNWLSGTKPPKVSLLNNFYVDPYKSIRVEKSRQSDLRDSLDVSKNAYAKWEQGTNLFMVENPHPSPPSSVKMKRRPQVKSNKFRRVVQQSYAPNDPYLIALELSKLISPETLQYPNNDCYINSRQQHQPECAGYQYDILPLVNPESTEYHSEEQLSEEKIKNFKIFLSLEKVDQIPGYPHLV